VSFVVYSRRAAGNPPGMPLSWRQPDAFNNTGKFENAGGIGSLGLGIPRFLALARNLQATG